MLRRRLPHRFKKIERADKVRLDIGAGVLKAVTHARLGCEMVDGVEPLTVQILHFRIVFEQEFVRLKLGELRELGVTHPLQRRVVVGCEAVNADDLVATLKQALSDVKSDEAG